MEIAILGYDPGSSGIASYTFELSKLLSKQFNITLITFLENKDVETLQGVRNILNIELSLKNRALPYLTYISNKNKIKKLLSVFDVVHETLPPWGSFSNKLITTKWGYVPYWELAKLRLTGFAFPENLGAYPVTLQHYFMDRKSFKNAKFIISINVEGENFVPPPIELKSIKKYNCNENLKLLFVSRDLNMQRKNLSLILEALKSIKRPVELHLVGNGNLSSNYSFKIFKYGYLPRDKIFEIMQEVDALILPSVYEELGFVGLEAYSVGLPVIASNILSFKTVYKIGPKFSPYDPIELRKILENLDCFQLERLGKDSWNYVKESNKIALNKLSKIYKDLMKC